jgi:hypothetical protein
MSGEQGKGIAEGYAMRLVRIGLLLVGVLGLMSVSAVAQQATISTPFNTVNSSFFERSNLSWGFRGHGVDFNFNNANLAVPQFGKFDANAGMKTGFAVLGGGNSAFFNFAAAQGSRQSFIGQTPSVTLMNGQNGYMSDTSQSPFVISVVPVVGGFPSVFSLNPMMPPPAYSLPGYGGGGSALSQNPRVQAMRQALSEQAQSRESGLPEPPGVNVAMPPQQPAPAAAMRPRRDEGLNLVSPTPAAPGDGAAHKLATAQTSSAGRTVPSVAEARRMHAVEQDAQNREAAVLFEKGRAAEEDGKPKTAKVYYDMVARRATGELKEQALARIAALRSSSAP